MKILYFARLRERFGVAEECPEPAPASVAELLDSLRARGGVWAEELAPGKRFRIAVDQGLIPLHGALDAPLDADSEVAIFPPVTGG